MKKFDKDALLTSLLTNERIKQRVLQLNLTKEECYEALPIMIAMFEEESDLGKLNYLTSFDRSPTGVIVKIDVLSQTGQKNAYRQQIYTLPYYEFNFDEKKAFHKLESRKVLVDQFKNRIIEQSHAAQGFYIYGPSGVGKTFILKRFAKLLAERGFTIGFISLPELVNTFKNAFGNNNFAGQESSKDELISILKGVDYLFLDDIGSEIVSPWFHDDILYIILSYRLEKGKGTFFSSNYSLRELEKVQARTSKERPNLERSRRLVNKIEALSIAFELKKET